MHADDPMSGPSASRSDSSPAPTDSASPPPAIPEPSYDWKALARRLLVCNPFFLCSAAMLLFGLNRLSLDPNFLGGEEAKLLFNFSALQLYQVLVVVTALVLMRRGIWYDSALLVVVDSGLLLVPFILISQGVMIDRGLGMTLAITATALAAARLFAIRRWYPKFNLPVPLIGLGLVVLVANVLLPLRVHAVVDATTTLDWETPNRVIWYLLLPLLAAGANFLPRPVRYGGLNPERHWLPVFLFALWIGGTAVHAWSCAYVCKQPVTWAMLAPLIFVCAWTLWNRLADFVQNPSPEWRRLAWLVPLATPLVALKDPRVFSALMVLNCLGYAALWLRLPEFRRTLTRFAAAALFLLLAGLPLPWVENILGIGSRAEWVALLVGACLLVAAARVFRPQFGLAAGICTGLGVLRMSGGCDTGPAFQAGVIALLIHSLLWNDSRDVGAKGLRYAALGCWLLSAVFWTESGGLRPSVVTAGGAFVVALAWWVQWRRFGGRFLPVVPITALTVMLTPAGHWLLRHGSDGMLALGGSLLLFAVGCALAWTRHRWERQPDKK